MFLSCAIFGVYALQVIVSNDPQTVGCLASKGSCEEMQIKMQRRDRRTFVCVPQNDKEGRL